MPTFQIELPDSLQGFVTERAAAEGYSNPADYVVALVRQAQGTRHRAAEEACLLAGIESLERGEGRTMTAADWERLRADIRTRYGEEE